MPDGDKVHTKLAGPFQPVYKQLCQGYSSSEESARSVLDPLKEQIAWYEDPPLKFLAQFAREMEEKINNPLFFGTFDLGEQLAKAAHLKREFHGKLRGMNLALEACEELARDVADGSYSANLLDYVMEKYCLRVYEADWVAIVPMQKPYNGEDLAIVVARLEAMQSDVEKSIRTFARQLARSGSVMALRLPPHAIGEPVSLGEEIRMLDGVC